MREIFALHQKQTPFHATQPAAHAVQETEAEGWHRILDWRPRSTLSRVLIVFLLVAPVILAATMMWAMWDPSKYMRQIDLAVVNEDAGVEKQGKYVNYGDQVVEGLLETDYLNFAEMNAQEANDGLLKGKYLMVVTIPKDFSEQAVTIISDKPVKPQIHFASNDYYGTNGSVISSSLVPQVQTSVENAISKKYADQVIEGMVKLSDGIGAAAAGASRLDEGAGRLDDGANKLATGSDKLLEGTGKLGEGASQIEGGVGQLTGMLIPLLQQAQSVVPSLIGLVDVLRGMGMTDQADQLFALLTKLDPANSSNMVSQLEKLRDGTKQLNYNLSDPNSEYLGGMLKLNQGTHQLAEGTGQLKSGVGKLSTGAVQLNEGAGHLAEGTTSLKDGTGQLKSGGAQLKDGIDRLKDGSGQLATKLGEGAEKAPRITQPDVTAQNMAVPINFTESNVHPVQTGVSAVDPTKKEITGGVSMLLVLVFGFLAMLLLAMTLPYYLRGILPAFALVSGINFLLLLGMALMSTLMGWHPASWPMMLGVLAAIAMVGAATYQLLLVTFGRRIGAIFAVGVFAMGVMVFGGVWPTAAIPAPLRLLHPLHPMTYAKNAFTRATDGIHDGTFAGGIMVLFSVTVLAVAASYLIFRARHHGTARLLDEHKVMTATTA
ncbi:YhgE/Pip family protein [Corynebacterium striatum]|uniref:YhgE/Pip family protein n=1 Tax=Corynebacterium striatum TaxID=43770 RepID=UPI0027BA558D|nr:YhgE/Pip domain-containing protein [Corynebacterium striatum]